MLKFIGTGSAFNTELGNNSAYYKWEDKIIIIDCGSSVFHRIVESNLLEGVNEIHVIVTHSHADHVGSLADLVLYSYFSHGKLAEKIITIYSPLDTRVAELLEINGCVEGIHYNYEEDAFYEDFAVSFVDSIHVEEIQSYSVHLYMDNKEFYYSSDVAILPQYAIKWINDGRFAHAYVDTCGLDYEGNVHLSYRKLCEYIKPESRHLVTCMHLDKAFNKEQAIRDGFNVAEVEL